MKNNVDVYLGPTVLHSHSICGCHIYLNISNVYSLSWQVYCTADVSNVVSKMTLFP